MSTGWPSPRNCSARARRYRRTGSLTARSGQRFFATAPNSYATASFPASRVVSICSASDSASLRQDPDLASVRTSAEQADGGWLITGRKVWTSGAHFATHCYVLARTEKAEKKHVGLSEFVVDMTTPGIDVTRIVDMAGEHHFNETVFDRVFVPEGNLIGVEGEGWRQVVEQLSFERGGPERVLSTYPLLAQMLERPDRMRELALQREVGVLLARLATLRRLCCGIWRAGWMTVSPASSKPPRSRCWAIPLSATSSRWPVMCWADQVPRRKAFTARRC